MECPICGIENDDSSKYCYICDSELAKKIEGDGPIIQVNLPVKKAETDPVQKKKTKKTENKKSPWKGILCFCVLALALAVPWFLMSDLFLADQRIIHARNTSEKFRKSYLTEKQFWQEKKNYIVSVHDMYGDDVFFEDLPEGIALAFLDDKTNLISNPKLFLCHNQNDFIMGKQDGRFILMSLEFKVEFENGRYSLTPKRLLRGAREVPLGLAWRYFGDELEDLSQALSHPAAQKLLSLTHAY
jgi:hypothetical protein